MSNKCVNISFRIFALQFLLVGIEDHMTMCFHCYENMWLQYDNDANKPPFQSIDPESLGDDYIYLVGYVNITQGRERKVCKSCSFVMLSVQVIF